MSWVIYLCESACSREYGQGEAMGRRPAALIRPANRGVHIRVGTYRAIFIDYTSHTQRRTIHSPSPARTNY